MADLIFEVARFQKWENLTPEDWRAGRRECRGENWDYEHWDELYEAVLQIVDERPFANWSADEVRCVLFVLACDDEAEHLAEEIRRRQPMTFLKLAQAAVNCDEPNAKWQLAAGLAYLEHDLDEAERLLLLLVGDDVEYVRRKSLQSLARLGSRVVEQLAMQEWNRPDESQQWSRMNVLWCLHRVKSPQLMALLELADGDGRQHLAEFAEKVRKGQLSP